MKSNFITNNPIFELKDKVQELQRKNDRLSILVVIVAIVSIASVIALLVYKSCSNSSCDGFDDDFDYFDDDFEDIDESDFE